MGKVRRQRKKYRIVSLNNSVQENCISSQNNSNISPLKLSPTDNILSGIDVSVPSLKANLDDTASIVSYKLRKDDLKSKITISKRAKKQLKHNILLEKMEKTVMNKNGKGNTTIEESKELNDGLPTIENFFQSRDVKKIKIKEKKKKKPIQKASKRREQMIQNVNIFKTLLNDKKFKCDPLNTVKEHVSKIVKQ